MNTAVAESGTRTQLTDEFDLRVEAVRWLAEDVVAVELTSPDGNELPEWTPGAHLDIVLPSGLRRQYSLCGDPADRSRYRIAVLRDDQGRGGSREIHDIGLCGRILTVAGMRNHFPLDISDEYLFIAGGIGVTPLLAMAREAARQGTAWKMAYAGRSLNRMALIDELRQIPGGDLHLIPEDEVGRPDLGALLGELAPSVGVYACGPAGMLDAIVAASQGLPAEQFHMERFGASSTPRSDDFEDEAFTVELARAGVTLEVPADRTLLEVVRDVLPTVPFSCEEGFCGACETRVLAGVPEHRDELLEDDREDAIMICVSRACGPRLTLDL